MGGGGFSETVSLVYREPSEAEKRAMDAQDYPVATKPLLVQDLDCTCPLDEYIAEVVHSTGIETKRLWKPSEVERMRSCPKHGKLV